MSPKIFLTGATGYIGGDILYALLKAHPDYEYAILVRNSDKGALVAASYPKVRLVYGSLDDAAILETEASKADVVLHTADSSDHLGAAKAIANGLAKGHTAENPGYWLHISGTGILCWKDQETQILGEAPHQQPYNDLEGVSTLTSLPDKAWHREVDKLVLCSASASVKTAIVCPPTVYGPGRGPDNVRSRQVYGLAKITLEKGQAPILGKGLTEWDHVHVYDLANLLVLLVDAAVASRKGENKDIDKEIWGENGYFLAENGHHVWGEVSQWVADAAYEQGYIKTTEVKPMDISDEQGLTWGLNSKGIAKRAKKFLGWVPTGKSLRDEIPDIVSSEAEILGLKVGYGEKVAGMN